MIAVGARRDALQGLRAVHTLDSPDAETRKDPLELYIRNLTDLAPCTAPGPCAGRWNSR